MAAAVDPGQRVSELQYKPWLCRDTNNGYAMALHLCCRYIAAVLFAVEECTQATANRELLCADVNFMWKGYQKRNVTSHVAENLDMDRSPANVGNGKIHQASPMRNSKTLLLSYIRLVRSEGDTDKVSDKGIYMFNFLSVGGRIFVFGRKKR